MEVMSRYMGQWTTPATAVLEAYVLVSFLIFLVMFMMCIHRHGCCVSVCFLSFFLYTFVTFSHGHPLQFTDCPNYSISVAADAEEELLDTNNREFAYGMNNKPTPTTFKKTLMKTLMALRSTVSGLEILLLWMLRMVVIVCMTFRDWRGLCALPEWLEVAQSRP
jgi:hypothetical protein